MLTYENTNIRICAALYTTCMSNIHLACMPRMLVLYSQPKLESTHAVQTSTKINEISALSPLSEKPHRWHTVCRFSKLTTTYKNRPIGKRNTRTNCHLAAATC